MYVALAALFPLIQTAGEMPFEIVVVVSLLTAIPGSVLLYGGYRLPRATIHPALYDRIAGWCLAGAGVMGGILALSGLVSGLTNLVPNALILTALGSGAGFGTGIYDAKAKTRAREAEQRSRELAYQNNRLENFARLLAHELRNPLAIAKGYHQQSQPRNEDAAKEVALAHERIEEMIDILLVTVRGSKVNIDDEPTVIAALAARMWDELSIQTESATLVVNTVQTIRGNPIHMQHLLANLFRNSIEHSEKGVTVRIGDLEDGFYVEDNGPGIPEDTHNDVVEAGFTTRSRGMGLGLTVVIQLADLYDWDWTLTDSESGGTRFEFTNVEFVTT
ncbi:MULTISPECIES: sensor histidine kinase [Natrialbaceae]|uniref:sensor histidine kinase n=1 Tax=Natrialbaceae TaxID=1644061 RepID=UPI00207C9221|nr:HAMP domain-containing sensor histidine kinase [Natronococcus sp. CG52]